MAKQKSKDKTKENETKQEGMKQEETKQSEISQEELQKIIDARVQEGIQKALAGVTPKTNPKPASEIQKEEFDKMGYRQRLELFKSNPSEYNKLAKGGLLNDDN